MVKPLDTVQINTKDVIMVFHSVTSMATVLQRILE